MKIMPLVFFLCAINVSGATEVVLLGGGGDPFGEKTIFDGSLRTLASKKNELQFNINSNFNGGHSETEKILSDELKVSNKPFTSKNYDEVVENYIKKIESGEIKPGEKLMVIVDTHGAEKTPDYRTHSIAMTGSEIGSYDRLDSKHKDGMDRLFDLAKAAQYKGVKLAIMDFSCHSGNSLPLANENTCVISSSGPNHYGYSNFASSFYENMAPGKNLEDVFLQTRMNYNTPSFPMISTKAGEEVNKEIYDLFSPYINIVTKNGAADKLSPYLNSLFQAGNMCKREGDFATLIKKLEDFQKISGALRSGFFGSKNLVDELKAFKELQDEYIKKLDDSGMSLLNNVELISYGQSPAELRGKRSSKPTPNSAPIKEKLSWRDIITQYPLSNRDYFEERLKETRDPEERRDLINSIDKYNKVEQKRQEILKNYPHIVESKNILSTLKNDYEKIWESASRVSEIANKFYDNLYREKSKIDSSGQNPCKDFTL